MIYFTMNNGYKIPAIGTGTNTYGKVDRDFHAEINMDTTELQSAIALGYRLIDTAILYRNEMVIGKAVRESGVPREDFFITSKIPGDPVLAQTPEKAHEYIQNSLKNLETDYIDLYLIHHPWDNLDEMVTLWKIMEEYVKEGKIRSLGVSNFDANQMEYLITHVDIRPVVNQIESHPGAYNNDIIEACEKWDIIPEAWGPLKRISPESIATLTEIGNRYKKSWAQVLLNYQVNRGVIVIPKSHNPINQKANFDILDFELTLEETEIIMNLE